MTNEVEGQGEVRADVVRVLRDMAGRGANAPDLVRAIQTHLGYSDQVVLPVLWYLRNAFGLSLTDILPLRELIGTSSTAEMNALLMPLIDAARDQRGEKPKASVSPVP